MMGCLLFYSEKRYLTNDIMSGNPTKKIRLDFQNLSDGNTGNEDLWGQDDLTAEEFDMLEIQATQSCNQIISKQNCVHNNFCNLENDVTEVNDLKQHQYELEGRVKLLSQSLEKSIKELREERINREQMINNRMKEFYERETILQKEIEKMRSILEFKDQEMKSTYSKLQVMKSQLKDRKNSSAEISLTKNFHDFSRSSNSGLCEDYYNLDTYKGFCRRHRLSIDCPKGETRGVDLLSSILCTRLTIPSFPTFESTLNSHHMEDSSTNINFTSLSVVQLKNEQKCDELLEHYMCFLKNRVVQLKSLSSKSAAASSSKSSPVTIKQNVSCSVMSFLCDVGYLLSCPKFKPLLEKYSLRSENPSTSFVENIQIEVTGDLPSEPLYHSIDSKDSPVCALSGILKPLLALADPETYPVGYPKKEEIDFSLSALLTICLSYSEVVLDLSFELPVQSLLNPHQSVTAVCITLKLLTVLCHHKKFALYLAHKSHNCILYLMGAFLMNIVPYYPEKFSSAVILIENFLSSIFSIHNIAEVHLETSHCISVIIQGIIKSAWKYYQLQECHSRIQIITKGFLLLHTLSSCIPNFKERRNSVEDEYILLISSILVGSKENSEFREFYDLAPSLWDFQSDTTEFDLEELPEETQASTNETDFPE